MEVSAGTRLGPYEILEPLGAGGMGEVYRAQDPRLGREVALKVLPPDLATQPERLQRFEREARAVAALNDPHILTVYDVGADDGTAYVVTEPLEGETLREVLTRRSPTPTQVLSFTVQAARGLAAAHEKGLVHRDLKPESLFLTTEGRIKILDFGLARLNAPAEPGETTGPTEVAPTRPGVLVDTVASLSPEQAQALPLDARTDIFSMGVVLYELLSGQHPFLKDTVPETLTAILHDTPPDLGSQATGIAPALSGIVSRCLEKRPEDRFQTAHDLALALEAVLQAPSVATGLEAVEERSPYPGLQSFTEKDAAVFFGREGEVEELWARIRTRRLLAVIGPSGVGKTSFIRAGVVARRLPGWGALVATPGAQPFRGLGRALGPQLVGDTEALAKLVDFEDPDTAFDLLGRWRQRHDEALLVLDQLEELFTLNPPEVQERFAGVLGRLAKEGDVHVVLALRDDFLMGCHDHEPLRGVFSELTPLGALKPDDLRRALVEPARKQGYRFEDEALVDEMVEAVEGARAALPLLAFAVSRLWERRDRERKVLKRESYEAIGGVAGALAQHAEQTLDRIGPERQPLVREIFRNLVTAQGTRAVADRHELLSVFANQQESAEAVLKELVDSRLLTSYEVEDDTVRRPERGATEPLPSHSECASAESLPSHSERASGEDRAKNLEPPPSTTHRIEIAHESLLRAWPRLVRWQAQDEEGAVLRDQLKQAAHLWEEKGRSPDVLWSGTALQEYELWRQRYPGKLTALEDDFAHAMVERDRRRRRIRRAAVIAAFVALAGVAAVIALSRQEALDSAQRAEASQLLALGQARLPDDPTEALAFATASLELADSEGARSFVVRALSEGPPARELDGEGLSVRKPAFSPDGAWLAAAGHTTEVGVWSEDGTGPIRLRGHQVSPLGPNAAGWTGTGFLVTGLNGLAERLHVWKPPGLEPLRTIELRSPSLWQVGPEHVVTETEVPARAPDRRALLIQRWRLPDGQRERRGRVEVPAEPFHRSTIDPWGTGWLFMPDRRTLLYHPLAGGPRERGRVLGSFEADAHLFMQVGPRDRRFVSSADGRVQSWSFPPDGPRLVSEVHNQPAATALAYPDSSGRWLSQPVPGMNEREGRVWSARSLPGARPLRLRRGLAWYGANATLHPSGDWYVASTANFMRLTFWPLSRRWPVVIDGYRNLTRPVAFSPDGRWLATSWSRNEIRLWPVDGRGQSEVRTLAAGDTRDATPWGTMVFDPGNRFVFVVGNSGHAHVLPLDGSPGRRLEGFSEHTLLGGGAVSPSGRKVATAFFYGRGRKTLRVWDLEDNSSREFVLDAGDVSFAAGESPAETGWEGGIGDIHFVSDSILLTGGDGGVWRWDLDLGSRTHVAAGGFVRMVQSKEPAGVLLAEDEGISGRCGPVSFAALESGEPHPLLDFGECVHAIATDPSGTLLATGDKDGVIRVGPISSPKSPHFLFGHTGVVQWLAISPDRKWLSSTGEDNTLRLWPMPDLDQPPLHTLPHDELIAKLKSLTNIRAVRDTDSPEGWSIQLDPFPGWKEVPTW